MHAFTGMLSIVVAVYKHDLLHYVSLSTHESGEWMHRSVHTNPVNACIDPSARIFLIFVVFTFIFCKLVFSFA